MTSKDKRGSTIKTSTAKIIYPIIASLTLIVLVYLVMDFWKHRPRTIQCSDGERQTTDYRDLQLEYSSKKISLIEIELMDELKVRLLELDPKVLQRAFESTQGWDQFLKGLVTGYNSCAVSKADYALILQRYKAMEDIATNLSKLLQRKTLTGQELESAKQLINQYHALSRNLFPQPVERKHESNTAAE